MFNFAMAIGILAMAIRVANAPYAWRFFSGVVAVRLFFFDSF